MKRNIIFLAAAMLTLSLAACGSSNTSDATPESNTTEQSDTGLSETEESSEPSSGITNAELSQLSDNEFYIYNGMTGSIKEFYAVPSGSSDWGNNYLTGDLTNGSKIIIALNNPDLTSNYDIKVISDNETAEYSGFNLKSTVQIAFYDNAQCDVSSI